MDLKTRWGWGENLRAPLMASIILVVCAEEAEGSSQRVLAAACWTLHGWALLSLTLFGLQPFEEASMASCSSRPTSQVKDRAGIDAGELLEASYCLNIQAALADGGHSQFCRAVSPKTEAAPSGHVVPRRVERKHACRVLYPR